MSKKVLIIAHGHPEFNKGGGEQAAYQFYQECLNQGDDAYFLARTSVTPHGGAAFSTIKNEREILFHTTHDDFFLFSNIKTRHLWGDFADLLDQLAPEIIYCHHYFLLGVEMMKIIKQKLPNTKLVLTLHEYYAICNNAGLMIKTGGQNKLCFESGTRECNSCFPDKSPGDFFLRKKYIMSCFEVVDKFIAPSAFLRQRYIDWGISPETIHVVENGQLENIASEAMLLNNNKVNIVYIGQINSFKGIDVLLDALLLIPKESRQQFCIDIHGANFDSQPSSFQEKVYAQLKKLKDVVRMHGSYEPIELASILSVANWVVVPSIWWENSPMVIQEALNHQKPVIVSDIGGMAEKVEHNKTGLHFRAGSPVSLADTLQKVLNEPELADTLAKNITAPLSLSESYIKINKIIS
ncbi:MAG TPA: glycosyltransferase [Pseudoalteromonas sp.]|uniref:Glycosyl transferase family 1 domain-containing protein n=1 Tax=marine sediment metagenome TaxID=412755 RepID=A0A0F9SFQ8_9ZZZZ|nr:glycosyltransferase family 4 protein [Pseudoalteromonas sp.]HDY92154.1 glycosyltransferase [Pseudoalteromonas sp.]HDZ32373.1 glycosyltransferase [Pseudoalteromonas sp.]